MFPRTFLRIGLALGLALAWLPLVIRANDVVPGASAGAASLAPRVLVLTGGKTLRGDIGMTQNGYLVALGPNTGRMFISEQIVWFTATSIQEAYRKLEKRSGDLSASGHVELARWCAEQGLYKQARSNLEQALRLDPASHSARLLAKAIGKQLSRLRQTSRAQLVRKQPAGHRASRVLTEEQLTRQFVARIQPLLINSCASVGCHGQRSPNSFQLTNVVPGQSVARSVTQSNRAVAESFIDVTDPKRSPLLTTVRDSRHSAVSPPLFPGPSGQRQRRLLASWVEEVARARRADESPVASTSDSSNRENIFRMTSDAKSQNGAREQAAVSDRRKVHSSQHQQTDSAVTTATVNSSDGAVAGRVDEQSVDAILDQAIQSGAPDAFNPDAFNRRFAPQTVFTTTSPSPGSMR